MKINKYMKERKNQLEMLGAMQPPAKKGKEKEQENEKGLNTKNYA